MSSQYEHLSQSQRIMVNDLIINGFRDLPEQASRYAAAMRQAPSKEAASARFDEMVREQREAMASQVRSGELRLPEYRDTPFASNGLDDKEDLARGRSTLRTIRDSMATTSRNVQDYSPQQMQGLVAQAKREMRYEPNGISPLNLPTAAPAAGLDRETMNACRAMLQEAGVAHARGDHEGANSLAFAMSRNNCPDTPRR